MKLKWIFISILLTFVCSNVFGQVNKTKKKKRSLSQPAIVRTEGAAIYESRSFDAPVVGYLRAGQKVRASKKLYKGSGGFGTFYKVVISKSLKGYVADVDLVTKFKGRSEGQSQKESEQTNESEANPDFQEANEIISSPSKQDSQTEPIYFTPFVGVSGGNINYSDKISGRELSSSTTVFGAKLAGPVLGQAPLDIDILFSIEPPSFYDQYLATKPSSGFMSHNSMLMKFPLVETPSLLIHYGLGLTLVFTKFDIYIGNQFFDSQELKLGVVGGLGGALKLGSKFLIQVDFKYYYEVTRYAGFLASICYNL